MTTQLDYTWGIGKETVYGTAVTPSRFYDADGELDVSDVPIQGAQMRAGKRVALLSRHSRARREVSGPLNLEVPTRGLGFLLEALLGQVTTTQVPTLTPTRHQQVHTIRRTDPVPSYTIQECVPELGGGTAHPQTFTGCVAAGFELTAAEGEFLKFKMDWLGRDMSTAVASTAAVYPTGDELFAFTHGSIGYVGSLTPPTTTALATLSGAASIGVKDLSIAVNNNLDGDGYNLGTAGKRTRRNVVGKADITGKMTVEYTDNTLRDAYLNETPLPLVATFTSPDGVAALQAVCPSILLRSEVPKTKGGAVVTQSIDFMAYDNGVAAEPFYLVYRSLDSAP